MSKHILKDGSYGILFKKDKKKKTKRGSMLKMERVNDLDEKGK